MKRVRSSQQRTPPVPVVPDTPSGVWQRAVVIVLAGAAVYSNSLSGPFIFDDLLSVVENPQIRQWWRLGVVFHPDRELPVAGRPLVNLSLAINYALGGLDPLGYHIINVGIHLLCALLIFEIVRRTFALPGLAERFGKQAANLAFAVALLWALHPLNTEAVNYVTQRTELMMALFYLLTLYAGMRAWKSARAGWWQAAAVGCCAAGMLCKESMVTAPVMVVFFDGIFLFDSLKDAFRARWRFYAGLAMTWVVLAVVMWSGPRAHSTGFSAGVSPWNYLLNQTVMITQYLRLTVWPRALVLNYGWPLQLRLGDVLPYALLITSLLALTIVALIRQPKCGFLGLWFFLTLAPTSSIVPIATEVGAERRMYLPLIALMLAAVIALSTIRGLSRTALALLLVVCSAGLAVGTFARNRDYESGLQLARTVVARHPTPVAYHMLGDELINAGQVDEGVENLRRALPGAPRAYYSLGVELFKQGKTDEAIGALSAFVREQPLLLEAVSARELLGEAFAREGRWPEAIEQYQKVLTMNPSDAQRAETDALLGEALVEAQRFDEAVAHYTEYLKAHPNDTNALTHLAVALVATGKPEAALDVFRRVADAEPGSGDAQLNLAIALFDQRNIDEASVHARRAVELEPGSPGAHETFGRVLAVQGKLPEARAQFEQTLQLSPNSSDAREDMAKLQTLAKGR